MKVLFVWIACSLIIYFGFVFVEFISSVFIMGDINKFWSDGWIKPLPHAIVCIMVVFIFSLLTGKKK